MNNGTMYQDTLALLLFVFPLAWSPGPGNMFFMANGARFGFKKTIPANIGYHLAFFIVMFFIGMGFAWVSHPVFLTAIKYAGSAYVFYLAWRMANAGTITNGPAAKDIGFWDGVILLVLNPKAYLIIGLIFAQFPLTQNIPIQLHVFWITTIFIINNLISFIFWILAGDRISYWLKQEKSARSINIFFAFVLSLVALWMLLG